MYNKNIGSRKVNALTRPGEEEKLKNSCPRLAKVHRTAIFYA